jgi:hypothetical protein
MRLIPPVHLFRLRRTEGNQASVERIDMAISQSAACARCDKEDCSAVVIIPAVRDNFKKVEHAKQRFELTCPACHRFYSVPFRNVEYCDVTDGQLISGFIGGQLIDSKLVQ